MRMAPISPVRAECVRDAAAVLPRDVSGGGRTGRIAGVVNATGGAAPDAWRRVVALLVQSLEAPSRGPLPDPAGHDALYRAMLRANPAGGLGPSRGKSS
jgi:hypothetical protein